MSRVSLLEQLYEKKNALEFNYDALYAPPIGSMFSSWDCTKLCDIATSVRYAGNINKKYKEIIKIMESRWFRKAHAGTNRIVFYNLEDRSFVAKVAVDKVGMRDNPAEFVNQKCFAPFCCKIHEVDSTGVLGFIERVNPITSLQEFLSVADDIFNLMMTKIIGKYVVDDLGTTKYMNYGLRYNSNGHMFGPVVIDFPYAFKLDGKKLICKRTINSIYGPVSCGGEIDYDAGMNELRCHKCGRLYKARELAEDYRKELVMMKGDDDVMCRVIVRKGDKVIIDSEATSKNYITKEQYNELNRSQIPSTDHEVDMTIRRRTKSKEVRKQEYYTELMKAMYADYEERERLAKEHQQICNVDETVNMYDREICILTNDNNMNETIVKLGEIIEVVHDTEPTVQQKPSENVADTNPTKQSNCIVIENISQELVGKTLTINPETGEMYIQYSNEEQAEENNDSEILKIDVDSKEFELVSSEEKETESVINDNDQSQEPIIYSPYAACVKHGPNGTEWIRNEIKPIPEAPEIEEEQSQEQESDTIDNENEENQQIDVQQPIVNPNKNYSKKKKKRDKGKKSRQDYFDDSDPSAYKAFINQNKQRRQQKYYDAEMEDY